MFGRIAMRITEREKFWARLGVFAEEKCTQETRIEIACKLVRERSGTF